MGSRTRIRRIVGRIVGAALMLVTLLAFGGPTTPARAAGPCGPPVTSVIACENSKPGDPQSNWQVDGAGDPDPAGLHHGDERRPGDTGVAQGVGHRVDLSGRHPPIRLLPGQRGPQGRQPARPVPQDHPARVHDQLVHGSHRLRELVGVVDLDGADERGVRHLHRASGRAPTTARWSLVPFVVRDESSHSDVVVQASDTTWQAYNTYGGNSLYSCTVACPPGDSARLQGRVQGVLQPPVPLRGGRRGTELAHLRRAPDDPLPRGERLRRELPQRRGRRRRGSLLLNHQVFVSSGHDEYWSGTPASQRRVRPRPRREPGVLQRQRGVLEDALGGGPVGGAPDGPWCPTRTPTSTLRPTRSRGPARGAIRGCDRPEIPRTRSPASTSWSTPGRPTSRCRRSTPGCGCGGTRPWRRSPRARRLTLGPGTGTLGYEWDIEVDNGFRPAGLFDLSSTTSTDAEVFVDYGSTTAVDQSATHHLSLYRAPSGALVFGAGTVQWAWGLDAANPEREPVDQNMQQATVNLLADMGAQPATLARRAGRGDRDDPAERTDRGDHRTPVGVDGCRRIAGDDLRHRDRDGPGRRRRRRGLDRRRQLLASRHPAVGEAVHDVDLLVDRARQPVDHAPGAGGGRLRQRSADPAGHRSST